MYQVPSLSHSYDQLWVASKRDHAPSNRLGSNEQAYNRAIDLARFAPWWLGVVLLALPLILTRLLGLEAGEAWICTAIIASPIVAIHANVWLRRRIAQTHIELFTWGEYGHGFAWPDDPAWVALLAELAKLGIEGLPAGHDHIIQAYLEQCWEIRVALSVDPNAASLLRTLNREASTTARLIHEAEQE